MRRRSSNKARELLERDTIVGLGKLVVPNYAKRLHWFHRLIASTLDDMLRFTRWKGQRGGVARVLISMPARHGKSLHGDELLPALTLGRYPDMKVMAATATARLARNAVRNTKNYMQKPEYLERYATRIGKVEAVRGDMSSGKVETENQTLMFRTLKRQGRLHVPADGYYMAGGIGGAFIGQGADIIIMDDWVKNAKQALSSTYQKSLWDFFLSTLAQRGDHPWATQLYIGHRWTAPDFADELLAHWQAESYGDHQLPIREIKLAAIAEEPIPDYDPREPGEGLDHEWFRSKDWYEGQKKALCAKRPWVWAGMWQQKPTLDGSKFFQPGDWQWYGRSFQLRERLLLVDFSIDAAMSEEGQSFFVINVYGYLDASGAGLGSNAGEHFFWLDERRGHWTIETLYVEFEYLWRKWSRALPAQFDEAQIIDKCPELYTATFVKDDESKHHARPRVWCENKALGHSFISRYRTGAVVPNVTTTLSVAEIGAVGLSLFAVPKAASKLFCYRTAGQVVSNGRMWLPQESFGEDPINPHLPLVDTTPLGVVWEQDADGQWHKSKGPDYEGSWVHEQGNFPGKPDDRRDVLAQGIICRTPWLGPHQLASR